MWRSLRGSGINTLGCCVFMAALIVVWPYMVFRMIFFNDRPLI